MIRCLIVDDSATFREVIRIILSSIPDLEVVGQAADGEEAIARTKELRPDVITMDVKMPRKDGLEAIAEIMQVCPTPIVVVSALAVEAGQRLSFRALELGAVEMVPKPHSSEKYEEQAEAIRRAVRGAAGVKLVTRRPRLQSPRPPASGGPSTANLPAVIGIAASTGGPPVLQKILSALPATYPIPILVVQHIAPGFSESMVRWLSSQCAVKVRLAKQGERLEPGTVLFAPDGAHLTVILGRVCLDKGPEVKGLRPSGTVLFSSLAKEFGASAAGLVLTGMGDDGAAGLLQMRDRGAFTAAQGPASSTVYGMPEVATRTGAAQVSLEIEEIAATLMKLAHLDR